MSKTMTLLLPSEVWHHVFGYLSPADKFRLRGTCKYFKKLVDHRSLWKNWSVVLRFQNGSYNDQFWATLQRRNVTSVVMRSSKAKAWRMLSRCLPGVTTLVIDRCSPIDILIEFPHLKRLAFRNPQSGTWMDTSSGFASQLTHLSICDFSSPTTSSLDFMSFVSKFTGLTSLVCHKVVKVNNTISVMHLILACLPKLKHLSLVHSECYLSHTKPGPPAGACHPVLSSLELSNCKEDSLTEDTMKLVPGLKSLAVYYRLPNPEIHFSPVTHLKTWLSDLPTLSSLVIVHGPPVKAYIKSIPPTVTSLKLCVAGLSSGDMAAVAKQIPNLLHLHIDPWPSHLGAHTGQIPQLFPKLKSLKLRHEHVPEQDFLRLHLLQDLEYLEVLDSRPHLTELSDKLRALTDFGLQVTVSPWQGDVLSCACVSQMDSVF